MLIHVVCQSTPRGRLPAKTTLGPVGESLSHARHRQQTRGYRLGMWSSYLHRKRPSTRNSRYTYVGSLNRRLSWEEDRVSGEARTTMRRIFGRYRYQNRPGYVGSLLSREEEQGRPRGELTEDSGAEFSLLAKADDIEDRVFDKMLQTEKSVWLHASPGANMRRLFKQWSEGRSIAMWTEARQSDSSSKTETSSTEGRCSEIDASVQDSKIKGGAREPRSTEPSTGVRAESDEEVRLSTPPAEEEYMFDPISMRRVPVKPTVMEEGTDESLPKTPKPYQAQFADTTALETDHQAPVHSDGGPPEEELSKYDEIAKEQVKSGPPVYNEWSREPQPSVTVKDPGLHGDLRKHDKREDGAVNEIVEDAASEYKDLHLYTPYMYEEATDGKGTPVPQLTYSDLDQYESMQYSAPIIVDPPAQKYDDLDKYDSRLYMTDEVAPPAEPPKYEDLDRYDPREFDDPNMKVPVKKPFEQYEDLHKYKAYRYREPDGKPPPELASPSPQYDDLEKYKAYRYLEPDGKSPSESASPSPKYEDLDKYKAYRHLEPDGKPPSESALPSQQYDDLDKYKAFRHLEPDGKPPLKSNPGPDDVAEACNHHDAKMEARAYLGQCMDQHLAASDAVDREVRASVLRARERMWKTEAANEAKVTGSYARDFPEEFASSWIDFSGAGLQPKDKWTTSSTKETRDNSPRILGRSADARNRESSRLQSALERRSSLEGRWERMVHAGDPFSKVPLGLETSYANEVGGKATWPSYVKTYRCPEPEGRATSKGGRPARRSGTPPFSEPTLYKILAYDPTAQKVTVGETTSVVPDHATPLPPAEVLLRVSHPSKFLPHLSSLQADGFEIVSGSGDVMVFRKVRAASSSSAEDRPTTTTTTPTVNPIDLMGRSPALPSAAAFVSPTGFVNYGVPPLEAEAESVPPRPAAFRSNIDVRREEPVFSGFKAAPHDGGRYGQGQGGRGRKKGMTKRILVGGAWVAGVSYALGVVGEYFTTGGHDGQGPGRF